MRGWFSILVMAGVLASCGGGETLALKIIFPDQAAKLAVTSVSVWAISPTLQAGCPSLLRGDSKPGDTGYAVDAQVTFPMPLSGADAPDPIKIDPPGRRLFLARAGTIGVVLLQGCTDIDTGKGGEVTVALEWVSSICNSDEDCAAANYCNDSHRCVSCSPSDPQHCGTECLDCGDGAICSIGLCSTADGGTNGEPDAGTVDGGDDLVQPDGDDGGQISDVAPADGDSDSCQGTCADGEWCDAGSCVPCGNNDPQHCGPTCLDCSSSAAGTQCLQGHCGCSSDGDCPEAFMCNTSTSQCDIRLCQSHSECAIGDCCSDGTCMLGSIASLCGSSCTDCTLGEENTRCVEYAGAYRCGCTISGGCLGTCCNAEAACGTCYPSCCGINCTDCGTEDNCCPPGFCTAMDCPNT
jgi:hypothetical protein